MIYGPIDEAKRIKGQEYDYLSKRVNNDGKLNNSDIADHNHLGTTSTGKGGVLDSVAQHHIEDIDLEKEKAITESSNILNEYMMYLSGQWERALKQYVDSSKSQLEKRMVEDIAELEKMGLSPVKVTELVMSEYYGLKNLGIDDLNKDEYSNEEIEKASKIVRHILKMRINYVNKITSLMANMLKTNYKLLGLSEQQAKIYIDNLTSGTNSSVKTAEEVKNLIKANTDKFVTNSGESIDLRPLGFGVILGPTKGYELGFVGSGDGSNKDGMMTLLQQAMRYDVVVVAHGGDRDIKNDYNRSKIINDLKPHFNKLIENFEDKYFDICDAIDDRKLYRSCIDFAKSSKNRFADMISITPFFNKYMAEIDKSLDEGDAKKISDLLEKCISDYMQSGNGYQEVIDAMNLSIKKRKNLIDDMKYEGVDEEQINIRIDKLNIIKENKDKIKDAVIANCTIVCAKEVFNNFNKFFNKQIRGSYWYCQPTKTLKAGPFEDVNDLVRQLIKEGYKKILIEDCNPGGHQLSDDIMKTPDILINHSDFSNWVESSIIDSNDENVLAINEAELSLKEFAESFDIDYSNDEYLEECCQWYLENVEYIEEGVIDSLKEFFKKILAGIINFFKKIFEFAKTAFYKLKALFTGTKEEPKNTKTNFQKPITTPLIDINNKKTIKIQCANREELDKEASKMCVNFSNVIKEFNRKHQEAMKKIDADIEKLEKQARTESYGGIDFMSKFLLEDMDLFDVFDDDYLLEFDAEGAPKEEEDEDDEFSMDDEGGGDEGSETPPAEEPAPDEGGEPAPAAEEPPAEDTPPEDGPPADDAEGEEFSMDEDPPEEDETDGDDNYEIPDDDEGQEPETQEGEAPPEDGPPADDGEDEFSMDGDSGEGGGDEGGEGTEAPADDAPTDNTSGEGEEDSETNTKLKELEAVIFDELSEDEKNMKITELKALYITVYKKCGTISEMLSGIKKDEETIQIIEYISNTLIDLREYVNDYINKVFDSKTYIENLSQLQKYIAIFNAINQVFGQIKAENEE